jgi:hypothetical protein
MPEPLLSGRAALITRAAKPLLLRHLAINTDPAIGRNKITARYAGINLGATRRAHALNW